MKLKLSAPRIFTLVFDYTIIQDIDDEENVRFAVYVLKNVSLITA